MDFIEELRKQLALNSEQKQNEHLEEINTQQFKQELRFLNDYSFDAINTIKAISIYSSRAKSLYDGFLMIRASDDLIQSIIAISILVKNGIHNIAKREIRYLLEMTVKYLVVDQELQNKSLLEKTQYLNDNIPNSSIDVIDKVNLPFDSSINLQFISEVKDLFYKSCAFIHPSQKQIEEQLRNYNKGIYIGFETADMLRKVNKIIFRAYDLILTMQFIGFGQSMSGDLLINHFDFNPKWKFHKGRYLNQYSKLFDYKVERKGKI